MALGNGTLHVADASRRSVCAVSLSLLIRSTSGFAPFLLCLFYQYHYLGKTLLSKIWPQLSPMGVQRMAHGEPTMGAQPLRLDNPSSLTYRFFAPWSNEQFLDSRSTACTLEPSAMSLSLCWEASGRTSTQPDARQ